MSERSMMKTKSSIERVQMEIKINISMNFNPRVRTPVSLCSRSISFRLNSPTENKIDEEQATKVISTFYFNPKLVEKINQFQPKLHVDLSSSYLIDADMQIIADQVIRERKCTELWLHNNRITCHGLEILVASLKENSTLKALDLSANEISDRGVRILSIGLHPEQKSSLKALHLNSNHISDDGVNDLAEMLRTNRTMTELWLGNNDIGWKGIEELTDVLAYENQTLKCLSLSSNRFLTDRSVDDLINMLRENQTLTKLWLTNCNISEQGKIRLEQIAKRKRQFRLEL